MWYARSVAWRGLLRLSHIIRYPTPKVLTSKLKLTHRSCHFGLRVGMTLSSGLKLRIVFN